MFIHMLKLGSRRFYTTEDHICGLYYHIRNFNMAVAVVVSTF